VGERKEESQKVWGGWVLAFLKGVLLMSRDIAGPFWYQNCPAPKTVSVFGSRTNKTTGTR